MKNLKFILRLKDEQCSQIQDAKKQGKVSKVKMRIEATHSGIVNGNKFFYTPYGMEDGTSTMVEPYNKPMMLDHNPDLDPVGRIIEASYVNYDHLKDGEDGALVTEIMAGADAENMVDLVTEFVESETFKSKDYKGLGHVSIIAEITDSEAIDKVLDQRYLTVSIGGGVDKAICSICGTDKLQDEEGACEHNRGEVYDGKQMFLIGGNMSFRETSFVSSPADKHAKGEVIEDSVIEIADSEQTLEILNFEIDDAGESKLKYKDIKALLAILADTNLVATVLDELGLSKYALEDGEYGKLRKSSYLFADQKLVPVNDKAHILAALTIMNDVEDSEEKDQIMKVLDRKFNSHFGKDTTFEDALTGLEPESKEEIEEVADQTIDLDQLADKVVSQLKNSFSVSDSFLAQRNDILEAEVDSLNDELTTLTSLYKDSLITQILALEDKVEDEEYQGKLKARTLDSLKDKLEDLIPSKASEEEVSDDENAESEESQNLEDSDISAEDAAEDEGEEEEGADPEQDVSDSDKPSISEVKTEYKNILKSKGISAASKYIKELRDSKRMPDNFTF